MWKNLATLPSATDSVPSNGWADAVVRAARAAVAPFIDPVAEAGHRRLRNRPGPILNTHHVTLVCAIAVRVQRACCCYFFRLTRPRRCSKLPSITLDQLLPRGASWAAHRLRYSPRQPCYPYGLQWSVAGLGELERCVTPVSVRMSANRCVLDGYGVSEVRGTAKHRCRALTGAITRVTQKREILCRAAQGSRAGLQHVVYSLYSPPPP